MPAQKGCIGLDKASPASGSGTPQTWGPESGMRGKGTCEWSSGEVWEYMCRARRRPCFYGKKMTIQDSEPHHCEGSRPPGPLSQEGSFYWWFPTGLDAGHAVHLCRPSPTQPIKSISEPSADLWMSLKVCLCHRPRDLLLMLHLTLSVVRLCPVLHIVL